MQKEIGWLLKEKYHGNPGPKGYPNFYKDVERLKVGEPVDYVIGFTEFLKCKIDLSRKPLIPRPETEFWVSEVVSSLLEDKRRAIRCLDLFSGSGCIAVAVLAKTSVLLCDIADKQKESLEQAKINCKLNGIDKKRYRVIKSDVFSNIKSKYDYIFANPPYIPTERSGKVGKSVLKFEPKAALFGGGDGLFYIRRFLKDAREHLVVGGIIFMEFDPPQKKEIEKIIKKYKYSSYEFHRDQYNRWRWVSVAC